MAVCAGGLFFLPCLGSSHVSSHQTAAFTESVWNALICTRKCRIDDAKENHWILITLLLKPMIFLLMPFLLMSYKLQGQFNFSTSLLWCRTLSFSGTPFSSRHWQVASMPGRRKESAALLSFLLSFSSNPVLTSLHL